MYNLLMQGNILKGMTGLKLSMWSSYYMDLSPEDAIVELQKYGYGYMELSDEHSVVLMQRGDLKETGKTFAAFAREHHVQISQGHLLLRTRITTPEGLAGIKKQLDLFRAIGISRAVLHCDSMSDESQEEKQCCNLKALRELTDYIRDTDMVLCLENLGCKSFTQSAEDLLFFIRQLGDDHLGICLDTGHLNLTKCQSQREFILAAGKHLKALHLADNEGAVDQHMMPFGRGKVDFTEVFDTLHKIGYNGLYNYELPGERKAPLAIRGYKLEYIAKMTRYLYGSV